MSATRNSRRLGPIEPEQFQAALDRFDLGTLISAEAMPFGLFGQNVKLTTAAGEFVLRGAAHYDWQFPKERLVASLLHTQTPVAAPWPYRLELDESIFGWRHGYVLMPYLAGLQLADPMVVARLTKEEQTAIAFAVGKNLRDLQRAESPFAGHYDHELGAFRPLEEEFPAWVVAKIRQSVDRCLERGDVTLSDRRWIETRLDEAREELAVPCRPVLVHHDYKWANLTVELDAGEWRVTGVFDLMEAFFGDGELDLVRQIAEYVDRGDEALATSFLDGFLLEGPLRAGALRRLGVYLIYDRMIIWDYFHQRERAGEWWYGELAARDWLEGYLAFLTRVLSESGRPPRDTLEAQPFS